MISGNIDEQITTNLRSVKVVNNKFNKDNILEVIFMHSIQNLNILNNSDYAYNVETYRKLILNNSGYDDTLINVPNQTIPVTFIGTLMNDIAMISIDGIAHSGNHIHRSDTSR